MHAAGESGSSGALEAQPRPGQFAPPLPSSSSSAAAATHTHSLSLPRFDSIPPMTFWGRTPWAVGRILQVATAGGRRSGTTRLA